MRTTTWIILGLAFNGGAYLLHGPETPSAADLAQTVPYYLPSAVLLAAGQFCFFRAFRSALGDVWRGLWGGKPKDAGTAKLSAAKTFAVAEPASDFDADEAFARYMERRKAMEEEPGEAKEAPLPSPPAPVRASGGFGRRVV